MVIKAISMYNIHLNGNLALLQVVTLVGEPFVFIKSLPSSGKCEDLDDPDTKQKHIKCTGKVYGEHAKMVASNQNAEHCCYGRWDIHLEMCHLCLNYNIIILLRVIK